MEEKKSVNNEGAGIVSFESKLIPSPRLIDSEKELMRIKAGLMEVGLLGFLLKQKEQIVLTSERLFQYSSRRGASYLRMMPLSRIESITIGGQLNFIMIGIAVVSIFWGIFGDMEMGGKFLFLLIGAGLIFLSRRKAIVVSSGDKQEAIILPLLKIDIKESEKFLNLISKNLKK